MTTLEPKTNGRPTAALHLAAPGPSTPGGHRSLTQAVHAAVRLVDASTLRRVARLDAGLAYQPKTLLALLSYCYARENYSSKGIADLMRQDAQFRQVCHNELPCSRVLRRFREANREAIHCCLLGALLFLAEQKVAAGVTTRVCQGQLAEEASRRITMAMFMDSMELDEDLV